MQSPYLWALVGGLMIGGASALLLLSHGRIAGISGISGGALQFNSGDRVWRLAFLFGLVLAGVGAAVIVPSAVGASGTSPVGLVVAGLLVGFGSRMGGGCTSGHGVCGLSRLSPRSFVAVATFMTTGAVTAMVAGLAS